MKKLSPKQKAIAAKAPPPDKIDAKDFAVLKAEKAKGRGMGLQDEKIKPGKVMTARIGKEIKADPTKPISSVKPKLGGGADASRKTFPSMDAMRKAKGFKPGETPAQFNKRRMMLEGAKKAAKATRIGKIAAGIGAVGVAASQFLKKKMEEKKENKKMGGGMMKKPMGYKSGTMVKARGCKLGRTRPTKIT